VYGPRDKDFFFLLKSLNQGVEMYINNTKQQLSFVHVSDLVEAIFIAMESDILQKKLIVSDGENYTSLQFNNLVKTYLNKKTFKIIVPASIAYIAAVASECVAYFTKKTPLLNRERLKEFKAKNWSVEAKTIKELGYKPKYTLTNGLKETIDWYKNNGWFKK
jgi:nucleoside-diphosphate-sugar epimerase